MRDSFKFYWEEPFEREEPNIKIDVPGFRKDNIKVKLTRNVLTIKASKKASKTEKGNGYYKEESFASSFVKAVSLPHEINPRDFHVVVSDGHVILKRKKKEVSV